MKIIQSFVIGKYFMQAVLTLVGWLLWGIFPLGDQNPVIHPFHVGVVEINHNAAEATLEVQCKLFTDDFEAVLSKVYKRKADLIATSLHASMDSVVQETSLLYELYDDQVNLIHFSTRNMRKSAKLEYPATSAPLVF